MQVHRIADIGKDHPPVWFSKRAITNILSLKEVIRKYQVSYDSDDLAFVVWREDNGLPNMRFKMHDSGLHFYDPRNKNFSFVMTVESNKLPFSKRQISGAEKARNLYASLGYPSSKDFKWILQSNQIKDCPVTTQDADVATKIWGPNIAALKGKTTRRTPTPVVTDIVRIPKEIRELHRLVTMAIDIFFVNKIPFLLTLSRNIYFTTVTHLADQKSGTIFKAFSSIYKYYREHGFQINVVTADNEFKPLVEMMYDLPGAPRLNLTAPDEHEPYIERRIRVVKERTRAVRHSVPFTAVPKQMLTHMIFYVVKLLNYFPAKGGVSDQYGPKAILAGEVIQYKYYSMPFGTYCQIHEEDAPRNSMAARTRGAISLGPSGNIQGGQNFYTLNTGTVVCRRSWTVVPMTETVIERVNKLAEDQPNLSVFYDRNGNEIGDADAGVDGEDDADAVEYEIPGVVGDDNQIPGVDSGYG